MPSLTSSIQPSRHGNAGDVFGLVKTGQVQDSQIFFSAGGWGIDVKDESLRSVGKKETKYGGIYLCYWEILMLFYYC